MAALPYVSIQPNYSEVFSDVSSATIPSEKVWLSYYASNAPSASVHVKLPLEQTKELDSDDTSQVGVRIGDAELSGGPSNGLKVSRVPGRWLDLTLTSDQVAPKAGATEEGEQSNPRLARTLQPSIQLDSPLRIRFATKTLTQFLPTRSTSKINDNYTNYPTIDAFDLSLGSSPDEEDLFVAGGAEGALYTGRLASDFDSASAREAAIATLTEDERHIVCGEGADPEEQKWELEARIRLHVNAAKAKLGKKTALKGHVGDVRFVKFFPSNRVVLSTSSDLSVRIWDPFTGDNPRTLEGHKRAVLTAGIVGRGKTVLTGAADGTVRLWDVATPKQIKMFGSDRYSAVNCLALDKSNGGEEEEQTFVVGLASGSWQMFDLRSGKAEVAGSKFVFPPGEAPAASDAWEQTNTGGITAIDVKDSMVVTGTANGIVSLWDIRNLSSESAPSSPNATPNGLVTAWRRNNAEINSIKLVPSATAGTTYDVLVATQDGLPYRAALNAAAGEDKMDVEGDEIATHGWQGWAPKVVEEYAGWDCDQTSWIGVDRKGRTVIAGAEGGVRRY